MSYRYMDMPGGDTSRKTEPSAAPSTPSGQPAHNATIARAVGVTAVAALLSLFIFRSTAFQQVFHMLVFQNSVFSSAYFLSIQGAVFFAFMLPIAYWVALVRLRHVERGRALVETIAISLLFGFVVYQLCDMIQLVVITWGMHGIDVFAPLRFIWLAPGLTALIYLPAILAAALGVVLALGFAPWDAPQRAISAHDGRSDLSIALGIILLIEVVETAIWSSVIQVFGLSVASPGSTRVRVLVGILLPALGIISIVALYALACLTTLRALRRASEA